MAVEKIKKIAAKEETGLEKKNEVVEKTGEWWNEGWSSFEEPSSESEEEILGDATKKVLAKLEPEESGQTEQEAPTGDHDDGTAGVDHNDVNFASMTYKFMYQETKAAKREIGKIGKGLKINQNDFAKIKEKTNHIEMSVPSQKFRLSVRAISMKYEVASWILANQNRIKKLFYGAKKESREYKKFFDEAITKMKDSGMNKRLIQ